MRRIVCLFWHVGGDTQWLSPDGCLMFSLQLHVPLASPLGERLSLLQHLVAVAVVNAVLSMSGYEVSTHPHNRIQKSKITGLIYTTRSIDRLIYKYAYFCNTFVEEIIVLLN